MKENSSEENFVTETTHPSISCTTKKNWQTPKLTEIDCMATKAGASGNDDGFAGLES